MIKKLFTKNWAVFALYVIVFAVIFIPYIKGIGNFWDWSWPVFSDSVKNIFTIEKTSWINSQLGRPLAYTSNYWIRLILSLTSYTKINPEIVLYLLLIAISSISSYFLYLIAKTKSTTLFSLVVGLLAVLNPAMFYKLVSGHMGYLISYPIFIALVYFLLRKFKKDLKSYIILGLFSAFVGVQIQFFVFAILVVLLFMIFKKELFSLKYSFVSAILAILINLPWLSNTIFGVSNTTGSSSQASSVSFDGAMTAKIQNVLVLAFSDATTIKYYFSKPEFVFFGLFSLLVMGLVVQYLWVRKSRTSTYFATLWIPFLILSTGVFHYLNFPPFSTFNPMFREVGHFAPILVLLGLIIIGRSKIEKSYLYLGVLAYLLVFGVVSGYPIMTKLPSYNFSDARTKFQSFRDYNDQTVHRVLTYPFFGQYSYIDQPKEDVRGRLIENSGGDSAFEFMGKNTLSNYLQPQEIQESEQYKLVKTYDIASLKEKNVRYIYDLSSIWESNFERYSGSEVYDNDLSLIKNDPKFFDKLMDKNPGELVEIEENIYEIVDTKPRIYGEGVTFEKISPVKYKINIVNLKDKIDLTFLDNYHSGWKVYPKKLQATSYKLQATELFDNSHEVALGYANNWEINPEIIKNALDEEHYRVNDDGSIDVDLVLYFKPQIYQNIGIVLAILTMVGSIGYLFYLKRANKAKK